MIDLHCHVLPGIDDGPQTLAEAVVLARMAVRNGITHAIVTPHIHPGRWNNHREQIALQFQYFRRQLSQAGIPLQLGMAAEVRVDAELIPWLRRNRIPFLGRYAGRQVLLLEMPHSHIPPGLENLIDWLQQRDIQPLIAHPERNKDVMRRLDSLQPLLQQGCLLQITAGSITGKFGGHAQQRALQLLEMGAVFAIATDAHNRRHRPPDLAQGRDAVTALLGEAKALQLVRDNPLQLVASQFAQQPPAVGTG